MAKNLMQKMAIVALCAAAHSALAQTSIITQWNFNVPDAANGTPFGGTVVPNVGNGSVRYIGSFATAPNGDPIAPMFRSGDGSSDPAPQLDDSAFDMSPFPAQGIGNLTSGLEVSVSTVGKSNILVNWDQRHSNRSSRWLQFQYSLDGVNFTSDGLTDQPSPGANGMFNSTVGDAWTNRVIDLSSIPGVNNNANFKFRVVAAFAPNTNTYLTTSGQAWDPNGRYRFDMVTVSSLSTSTNIDASARAQPKAAITGGTGSTLLVATVTPGAAPVSTGIVATVDLTQIGGSATQALNDLGQNGDASAGDGRFSFNYTVPATVAPGVYFLPVSVSDAQNRTDTASIRLEIVTPVNSNSPVVISQLFSSGGAFGSRYNADYAELFNRSAVPQDISGWSVQGASDNDPFAADKLIEIPSGTILPPGGYYLIQLNPVAGQYGLPLIADLIGSPGYGIGQPDGKVGLAKSTAVITSCNSGQGNDPNVADLVGYGHATDCFLGAATPLDTTVLTATMRKDQGCQDTRQNFHDFSLQTPAPRNSFSPTHSCPPLCTADFNGDGVVDFFDYLDFVAAFSSNAASADFNGDTTIDFFDYLDFVAAFSSGC
jgi:hypothetical protein